MKETLFEGFSESEQDTEQIANRLAQKLTGGETIILVGELGAGKTTFTKALFKELSVRDLVTSPTFTIMKTYRGRFVVHHLDMYRIGSEDEVEELGLREEIGDNDITVIEWNKFTDFKGKIFTVILEYLDDNKRKITIEGEIL